MTLDLNRPIRFKKQSAHEMYSIRYLSTIKTSDGETLIFASRHRETGYEAITSRVLRPALSEHEIDIINEPLFKVGDVVETYSGQAARIIATDRDSPNFPIVALVRDPITAVEDILLFTENGAYLNGEGARPSLLDLIPNS